MPIYEYKCNVCKKQFEILVTSIASADGIVCTDCKSPDIRKIISSSSYRLNKGSSIPSGSLSGCSAKSGFS
jgi:putative FmdB family regulatory protein